MKTIKFDYSNLSCFQSSLVEELGFEEKSFQYFEYQNDKNETSFFRRIFMESGFEVWIYDISYHENINIYHISSNVKFKGIHYFNFKGNYTDNLYQASKEFEEIIFEVPSEFGFSYEVSLYTKIKGVSFVFSQRWIDVNINYTNSLKEIFEFGNNLSHQAFSYKHTEFVHKCLSLTQNGLNYNQFVLKLHIYQLLNYHIATIKDSDREVVIKSKDINILLKSVESKLSSDFTTPIYKIYAHLKEHRIRKKDFDDFFDKIHHCTLDEYRKKKRMELSLNLLNGGLSINDIAEKLGYISTSKFIVMFKKTYGDTPYQYRLRG